MRRPFSGGSRAMLKRNIVAARMALGESVCRLENACQWSPLQVPCHDQQWPKAIYGVPGESELVAEFIKALEKGPREISSLNGLLANKFNDIVRKSAATPFSHDGKNDGSLKTWLAQCGFVLGPVCNRNQSWLYMPEYPVGKASTTQRRAASGRNMIEDEGSIACAGAQSEKASYGRRKTWQACMERERNGRPAWKTKEMVISTSTPGKLIWKAKEMTISTSTPGSAIESDSSEEVQADGSSLALLQPILESGDEQGKSREAEEKLKYDDDIIEIVESDLDSMWTIAVPADVCEQEQEHDDSMWTIAVPADGCQHEQEREEAAWVVLT